MKRFLLAMFVAIVVALALVSVAAAPERAGSQHSPIFGVTIPDGYRQWGLIAPSQQANLGEVRAILGNAAAMKAYREGTLPFPDGAMLAKLAWTRVPSSEFESAFVPGPVRPLQFMVKDAKKYASTGRWGFGRFLDGTPADETQHQSGPALVPLTQSLSQ